MNSLTAAANLLTCTVNKECEKAVKNLAESALTAIEEVSVETKKHTTLIAQQTTNLIAEAQCTSFAEPRHLQRSYKYASFAGNTFRLRSFQVNLR